jgi:hypothetical protein
MNTMKDNNVLTGRKKQLINRISSKRLTHFEREKMKKQAS